MRFIAIFSLSILMVGMLVRAQTSPSDVAASDVPPTTQPAIHATDLLGPPFTSHVHGIEFRPPLNSVQADKSAPDSIAEFDQDAYNWQLKAWTAQLQHSLPLTIHKDQFGNPQDGVMEVTLANIKQQSPDAQVLRNEVINVGRMHAGDAGGEISDRRSRSAIHPAGDHRSPGCGQPSLLFSRPHRTRETPARAG